MKQYRSETSIWFSQRFEMARPIKSVKEGVAVKITPSNSKKIIKIIGKTHRTFASEVNLGVEEYADKKIVQFKDNGK